MADMLLYAVTSLLYAVLGWHFWRTRWRAGAAAAAEGEATGIASWERSAILAPFTLHEGLLASIRRETRHAQQGKRAHIIAKMNSLVERGLIEALYSASRAGVKIDLIVRGMCTLRPGVPGRSERIRVVSVLGRLLEHSRVYRFENDGVPEVFIGSADLRPRNLRRRVDAGPDGPDVKIGDAVVPPAFDAIADGLAHRLGRLHVQQDPA